MSLRPPLGASRPNPLPYRKPQEGRDYWVIDNILADPMAVRDRALAAPDWELGLPYKPEFWPGKRHAPALLPEELSALESLVMAKTGAKRLWEEVPPEGKSLNHNCIQIVGATESGPRPHSDSRKVARYAGVVYLSPKPSGKSGTTFYRQRLPNGTLGGNMCPAQFATLPEALGLAKLPLSAWAEDVVVPNAFNRFLLYRADLIHSATGYFGHDDATKRMTALFFWMA